MESSFTLPKSYEGCSAVDSPFIICNASFSTPLQHERLESDSGNCTHILQTIGKIHLIPNTSNLRLTFKLLA